MRKNFYITYVFIFPVYLYLPISYPLVSFPETQGLPFSIFHEIGYACYKFFA